MNPLRIASFLPAATEMVCALGLIDHLVGISHECDYPIEVAKKPVVVRCALDLEKMSLREIDQAVTQQLRQGKSLYQIDEHALQTAAPNLIITQDLCQVCAPSGNEVTQVLAALKSKPEILWQTPKSFESVLTEMLVLGEKTKTQKKAKEWVHQARQRVDRIVRKQLAARTRAFFLEWVDPIYCGGHWIPTMLRWAGAEDSISREGTDSVRIEWQQVLDWNPQVLIVSACGFGLQKNLTQAEQLKTRHGWSRLDAVRNHRVYAVNANAYFSRPGPRLVDGLELLAHLFHPELFPWSGADGAFAKVDP